MNRNFLVALAAAISVFAIVISGFTLFLGSSRLLSASDKVARRSFESQSKIFTTFVREDLLIDNTLAARKKLEKLRAGGSISGYSIVRNGENIEGADSRKEAIVSIETPVYFTNTETTEWGRIRYDFSVSETERERRLLQFSIWLILVVQTVCLLLLFLFSFGYLYKTTGQILNLLSEYILDFKISSQGGAIEFVWSPVLSTLRQSSAKYKELRNESIKLEKEAAVGRITAQLSHDMRAPLGTFERLLLISSEKFSNMKPSITDSLNRIYAMIDSLRFGEAENLVKRSTDRLSFSFGYTVLKKEADERGISLQVPQTDLLAISIDHPKVERSWINLASNALAFAHTFVSVEALLDQGDLVLRITDDGPGIPTDFVPKLFQRGATFGKADGTGLGLAYVRQIMRGHGGDAAYRRENGLTVFECIVPQAFFEKEMDVMVKPLESRTPSNPRLVAICLEPESLAKAVQAQLASFKNENFLFSCEYHGADSVVSNDQDILVRAMDEGKKFTQVKVGLNVDEILDRLTRKFNLC